MSPDQLFAIGNNLALLGWLALAIGGRTRWVAPLLTGVVIPLLFALAYGVIFAQHWGETADGGFGGLGQVGQLFANRWILLAGWLHYLAFDLFIGSWEVRDAKAHGISHFLVLPCLALTFLLGPMGLLLYFLIRFWQLRSLSLAA